MNKPLITIGITCYNAVDTIERTIQSAIYQDWPNKEIIVVDDASSDNSIAVIEKLAGSNSNIRVIRHEDNKGCPSAQNTIFMDVIFWKLKVGQLNMMIYYERMKKLQINIILPVLLV